MTEIERLREALEKLLGAIHDVSVSEGWKWNSLSTPDWFVEAAAALSTPPAAERGEWQPIESAPKTSDDFTSGAIEILAWIPDPSARHGGDTEVVWWEPKMGDKKTGCWWFSGDFEVKPTDWQPVPAPPSPRTPEGQP